MYVYVFKESRESVVKIVYSLPALFKYQSLSAVHFGKC